MSISESLDTEEAEKIIKTVALRGPLTSGKALWLEWLLAEDPTDDQILRFLWTISETAKWWDDSPNHYWKRSSCYWNRFRHEGGLEAEDRSGIYFLWDGEELVYIGISYTDAEERCRMHSHLSWGVCLKPHDRISVILDQKLRLHEGSVVNLEMDLIDRFQPRYNVQGKGPRRRLLKKLVRDLEPVP